MTKDREVIINIIIFLKKIIKSDNRFGRVLVGYYKQILPSLNSYMLKSRAGQPISGAYGKLKPASLQSGEDLSKDIDELLELFEKTGGPEAYPYIKYMIPTYESANKG